MTSCWTQFWDGMDGDGWCQDYDTEEKAMEAHQKAVKNPKTLESRVYFFPDGESGKIIVKWTRNFREEQHGGAG